MDARETLKGVPLEELETALPVQVGTMQGMILALDMMSLLSRLTGMSEDYLAGIESCVRILEKGLEEHTATMNKVIEEKRNGQS
jgi:hypothetical protein